MRTSNFLRQHLLLALFFLFLFLVPLGLDYGGGDTVQITLTVLGNRNSTIKLSTFSTTTSHEIQCLLVIRRFMLSLDIHSTEDDRFLVGSGNNLVYFVIVHIVSLSTPLFLIGCGNGTLETCSEVINLCLMVVMTYQELFLFLLCRLVIETTRLDNLATDGKLMMNMSQHSFFDALLRDDPKNSDDLGLTDTMRTILSLKISVRIPIRIAAVKVA